MSKDQEENVHGQPREGQPQLYKHQQVTHRQPQEAPQVTWMTTTPIPASSPRGTAHAVGPVAGGHREFVPPSPRGTLAAGSAWEKPSPARRTDGLWHGSGERQGHGLPPVQPTCGVQIRTGAQPAWEHLEPSETEELIKVQEGHGGNTCSDLFRDLAPYLRENRSIKSTSSSPKWLSARQEAQGTPRPAEQTARHKQLCPEDEDALMHLLRKKREQLEEMEDKVYAGKFTAIMSSLGDENDKENPVTSPYVRRDASNLTLEPAAGPSVSHSICSVTKDAAGETQSYSELVSLDQLLAELCPVSDDPLSCDAVVKELLEQWEEEKLPDREAAGERDSKAESPLSLAPHDEEEEPAASVLDSDPCDEGHREPLPMALSEDPETFAVCALPADPADEANAAGMEAGCAQAAPAQDKPCGTGAPAEACPLPAQPLALSVPSSPAGSAAVPQPPAPRRWRSMLKTARRALSRVFSFSCLRGQPEE